jgi:hypothetical protein
MQALGRAPPELSECGKRADSDQVNARFFRRLVGLPVAAPGAGEQKPTYTARETALLLLGAVAFTGGLIHVGAAVDHYQEYHLYTVVFGSLAAVQFGWATLLVRGPSRRVLLLGCAFNLGVVCLWTASRTVGVPLAPQAWVPEAVGVPDLVETVGELVAAIGACWLAMPSRPIRVKRASECISVVSIVVLLLTVLYGVGAHAG